MRHGNVPVTMGSPRFRRFDAGACCVVDAWFPPRAVLQPHTHARGNFATMLEGSFETHVASRRLDCTAGVTWTEPAEERHANHVGSGGARVLVIQPDTGRLDLYSEFQQLMNGVSFTRHPAIVTGARRILAEISAPDSLTSLVVDSIALPMMATAIREGGPRRTTRRRSPWLLRAQEIIHEQFTDRLQLSEIAAHVGVTPCYLARSFRSEFGMPVGEYARALRINWALHRLATTECQVSEIAVAAGYTDQSHLTRACKATIGVGPAAYRRLCRDGTSAVTSSTNARRGTRS